MRVSSQVNSMIIYRYSFRQIPKLPLNAHREIFHKHKIGFPRYLQVEATSQPLQQAKIIDSQLKDNRPILRRISSEPSKEDPSLLNESHIIRTNNGSEQIESDFFTEYIDTLAVTNELLEAGFNEEQAKKIILIAGNNLSGNLERVIRKHVPKIDLENENYLFEAASSELRVAVKHSRQSHKNEIMNNLALLERELNAVTDELNERMIECKNDAEVAMNDHKTDNTLLQRQLKIKIRQVENRINSQLISELKFGIENLRWSLTRRGIFCILSVAASVLIVVTGNKILTQLEEAGTAIHNSPTKDEDVLDNDEFQKDPNEKFVQYEEWHSPKKN